MQQAVESLNPKIVSDLVDTLVKERAACLEAVDNFTIVLARLQAKPNPRKILDVARFKQGRIAIDQDIVSSDDDIDESLAVNQFLRKEYFTETALRDHLTAYAWTEAARTMFGKFIDEAPTLTSERLWETCEIPILENRTQRTPVDMTDFTIFDVGTAGKPLYRRPRLDTLPESRSKQIWELLAGAESLSLGWMVGKVVVVREPLPCVFAALHLTMHSHYEMDDLYQKLSDDSPTQFYLDGCRKIGPKKQKSFLFVAKYKSLVGHERRPMEWQNDAWDDFGEVDGIRLSNCSSVVALSLSRGPTAILTDTVDNSGRIKGHVFDPLSPWRVLSIQCFPDWNSSADLFTAKKRYANGPEAFLMAVIGEYRDAAKRMKEINERLTAFIQRERGVSLEHHVQECLKAGELRSISRYSWVSNTLNQLNVEIKRFLSCYKESYTDDVWSGNHPFIWPGPAQCSPRHALWRRRMMKIRSRFELPIKELEHTMMTNENLQKQVNNLRNDIYVGFMLLRARKNVETTVSELQMAHNIKLLVFITLLYLPLLFVACLFGLRNMPTDASFVPFGITLVSICVPTYLFVGFTNLSAPHSMIQYFRSGSLRVYQKIRRTEKASTAPQDYDVA